MKLFLPVKNVRVLEDPIDYADEIPIKKRTFCHIEAKDIPATFRNYVRQEEIDLKIKETVTQLLFSEPKHFHLYFRPITICVDKAIHDNRKKKIFVEIDKNNPNRGIMIGAEILEVILEHREDLQEEVYVELEFIRGLNSSDVKQLITLRGV